MRAMEQVSRRCKGILVITVIVAAVPLWTACRATGPEVQLKELTYDVIYGPDRISFDGHYARGLSWRPDGRHYAERREGVLMLVDAETGEVSPAYDVEAFEQALSEHEDFDESAAARLARRPTILSDDYAVAALNHGDRLYVYDLAAAALRRVADADPDRELVTLSPDQTRIAFVKSNDLYVIDIASGNETRLTSDGSDVLLNGKLDWVYQEEVYGRGRWRAYWWSDDGSQIAFLRLDQSQVPVYTIVDHLPTHPTVRTERYPKAGDPNAAVRLGVVSAGGGEPTWVDLSSYESVEPLVVRVGWAPDGRVVYCVQDREQRWLDLCDADPRTGAPRTLLHEQSSAWVEPFGLPHWLSDGRFLWRSDRDGWPHLYLYGRDGELLRRVTAGEWEVRRLHGVDEQTGLVYLSGTRDSHVESQAYRVPLAGGTIERLTEPGYSHRVRFDPQFRYFIDTYSNITTPTRVDLRRAAGGRVRVISANRVTLLDDYRLSPPELLRIPTNLGHELNAMLIRPPDMRPDQKYPVVVFTYGGPHGSVVHNRWGGTGYMFKQFLARKGYLVWTCDPYSASGEGSVSAWHAYLRLGVTEIQDLEESLRWLAENENADLERVAIEGYSYGGFIAAYALTHSRMFKVGEAGAGLSDWRNYDSIYTERYMRTPANNPEGYEVASVRAAADKLHGHLLLVHGTEDDNVHLQNTLQMAYDFQRAGKRFDMMLYPRNGHGIGRNRQHWLRLRLEYIEHNL